MTRKLKDRRRGPADAKRAVVFLHGYGADGADLLGLAEPLAPHLPDTLFAAPDAPERCRGNPHGYQWFPIPWLDGSSEVEAGASLARSADDLDAYLDQLLGETGLAADRVALVGFSQGTMMALHVAPRRAAGLAAVVGFSGRLLGPERLSAEAVSRPPVLLLHGDLDEVVAPASTPEAAKVLRAAGFDVEEGVMRGTAHGIGVDGLTRAVEFLRERLGVS